MALSARLHRLYDEAADARAEEHVARRYSASRADECRRRYRSIVDEIHKLNLERKRRERLEGEQDERDETTQPARKRGEQWWLVLGVHPHAGRDEVNTVYRKLARKHHPDAGGTVEAMARINAARDQALAR
ncbi:J domain-containing protein [Bosea massiliensis]|uniref:J domain-containing protein n=1 Tax=Bosea massiliensis TaxID=151419 RepID=A0ABW0P9N0_9HYPH